MASGGARVRSGPAPDPNSRTSERRGYTLSSLPNGGYAGRPPKFPLPDPVVCVEEDGVAVEDKQASAVRKKREQELWRQLWKTPQACAWSLPQYSYLIYEVGLYCRLFATCEDVNAKAADRTLLPRYADRIGLSAAGLAALGWRIVPDEIAARRMAKAEEDEEAKIQPGVQPRRLRLVK